MAKSLVIVESPAKARTIRKYLGNEYDVKASVGHIIDLPPNRMGVDLESGDFTPEYVPIQGKGKIISDIQKSAKHVDQVYLAPDPDREGEAIAFHLADIIHEKHPKVPVSRVRFHEITKKAVLNAFSKSTTIDTKLYDAQQARRILDRIVGYQISPILWKKVRRGLSAGRVQSVALRLVVDREREIQAFKTQEYWSIEALSDAGKKPLFTSKLLKTDGKKAKIENADQAGQIKSELEAAKPAVSDVTKKRRQRKPGPPFITSKLQQDAARAFRFTAKRTMMIAQSLYEGIDLGEEGHVGLITYMRTDSTRVSNDAIQAVRGYIGDNFGPDFLPEKPNFFKTKKSAQEAHEAIRPTSMHYTPDFVKRFLKPEQFKLYKLIWERFVASQMSPAQYDRTQIDITADKHLLRATGSILVFEGFLKVYQEQQDEDDKNAKAEDEEEKIKLPAAQKGDLIIFKKIDTNQHFTEPPPRFSEASLVKELEDKGIGRPSTYASILSVIQDKEYVEKRESRFYPSELGLIVTDLLIESFPKIMDISFTAGMEENLDKIEEGDAKWKKVLQDFYEPFKASLKDAQETMRNVKRMEEPTDITCSKCNEHKMVIKWGKTGSFLGCSGYPDCKNTIGFHRDDQGKIVVDKAETTDTKCKKCEAPMVVKRGKFGTFLGCSRYPDCSFTQPMPTGIKCPKCSSEIAMKKSQRAKVFYGCSSYPKCNFLSWDKPINTPCPVCENPYLVEKNLRSGSQIKCPKCDYKKAKTE
ncbi:MAG: type I DNA topoisomerase [Deltaproteobacteria bacterium]|nr:type I DNA topoisomerase [Deltaproteobacteria bacterium]